MEYDLGKALEELMDTQKSIINVLGELLLLFREAYPEAAKKVETKLKEVK